MAQDDFYKWFQREVRGQIDYVLQSNMDLSTNIPKQNAFTIYSLYLQKRLFNQTRWLVWATWGLAIGTLILAGLTIYFSIAK